MSRRRPRRVPEGRGGGCKAPAAVQALTAEAAAAGAPRPQFLIIGGANGSGKSTLTSRLVADTPGLATVPVLNPDVFTTEMIRAGGVTRDIANIGALRQVATTISSYIAERQTFIAETVLANTAYRRHALDAKKAGYEVRLVYAALPTVELCLERIAARVANGGHSVPEADVKRRWAPSHAGLAWFAEHMDDVQVYSNALFGGPPKLVATAQAGLVDVLDPDELPDVTAVLLPLAK